MSSLVYCHVRRLTHSHEWAIALVIFFEYFYNAKSLSFRNLSKTPSKEENSLSECLKTCMQMYVDYFPTLL